MPELALKVAYFSIGEAHPVPKRFHASRYEIVYAEDSGTVQPLTNALVETALIKTEKRCVPLDRKFANFLHEFRVQR